MENGSIRYKGRLAESYPEKVLYMLTRQPSGRITADHLRALLKEHGVSRNNLYAALSNFKQQGIIDRVAVGLYHVEADVVSNFADKYLQGKVSVWHRREKTTKGTSAATVRPMDIVRAILAAYRKPMTLRNMVAIAKHHKHDVNLSTFRWFQQKKAAEILRTPLKDGKAFCYSATAELFIRNARDLSKYITILPVKKADLLARFNEFARDEVKKFPVIDPDPATDTPKLKTATEQRTYKPGEIIRALCAADPVGITFEKIAKRAEKHGLCASYPAFDWFQRKHSNHITKKTTGDRKRNIYDLTTDFFNDHEAQVQVFCTLLPAMKARILANFKEYCPELVARYERQAAIAETPSNPVEDPAKDLEDQVQAVNEQPEAIEAGSAASPPMETQQQQSSNDAQTDATETVEDIDAWKVGAAILSYVQKLKIDAQAKTAPEETQKDIIALQRKYENIIATLTGLRAERNSYKFQVEKLTKIIDEKDRRINAKDQRIQELERKLEVRRKAIPTTFKMNEVANITRVIKGDRVR